MVVVLLAWVVVVGVLVDLFDGLLGKSLNDSAIRRVLWHHELAEDACAQFHQPSRVFGTHSLVSKLK